MTIRIRLSQTNKWIKTWTGDEQTTISELPVLRVRCSVHSELAHAACSAADHPKSVVYTGYCTVFAGIIFHNPLGDLKNHPLGTVQYPILILLPVLVPVLLLDTPKRAKSRFTLASRSPLRRSNIHKHYHRPSFCLAPLPRCNVSASREN